MRELIPKKILVVTNQFYPDIGGIQIFSKELANFLANRYTDVHVLCAGTQQSEPGAQYSASNTLIPRESLGGNSFLYTITNLFSLLKTIRRVRPEIIIAACYYPIAAFTSAAARIFGIKHIACVHGSEPLIHTNTQLQRKFWTWVDNHIDIIIFNSMYQRGIMEENGLFTRAKRKEIIPPIPPSSCFCSLPASVDSQHQNPYLNEKISLLTIGKLAPVKGIHLVIQALHRIRHEYSSIRYTIIGRSEDNYEKYLLNLTTSLNLEDTVHFAGELSPGDKRLEEHLANADIFIMPSRRLGDNFEGFGIVYFEAIGAGLRVIGSQESGLPDIKMYFRDVTIIDPGSIDSIVQALQDSIKLGKQDKRKAIQDREAPMNDFLDDISAKWVSLIEKL